MYVNQRNGGGRDNGGKAEHWKTAYEEGVLRVAKGCVGVLDENSAWRRVVCGHRGSSPAAFQLYQPLAA